MIPAQAATSPALSASNAPFISVFHTIFLRVDLSGRLSVVTSVGQVASGNMILWSLTAYPTHLCLILTLFQFLLNIENNCKPFELRISSMSAISS